MLVCLHDCINDRECSCRGPHRATTADVSYVAPSGWTERLDDPGDDDSMKRFRFHMRENCPSIRVPESLTATDRPGSAARCPTCARE